jgi:hypothetical protein
VPSSSNFPASRLGSQFGLFAQSDRAFLSSPPQWPTYTIARPAASPPARQHQGQEVVSTCVRTSSIKASIALMTNAVETSRILHSPHGVCDSSSSTELYGEHFLPICIESAR